jgi:hypothetical protein
LGDGQERGGEKDRRYKKCFEPAGIHD